MWRGDVLTRGSDVRSNMILNRVNWSCKRAWNLRRVNQYPYKPFSVIRTNRSPLSVQTVLRYPYKPFSECKHFSVAQMFLNKDVFFVQPSVTLSQQWEEIA